MANEVYANSMEIACRAAAGKSIAAFPDTCLSPPSPPAGPVPIPYPNTAYASDTSDGSTTVMISGQEVMLKDQSTFKKSTGDEAATKSLGMGVVTHAIQGEASFVSWSMDVKIEGQNVDRHLDQMLHNEQSVPANTATWPYIDASAMPRGGPCSKEKSAEQGACDSVDDACKDDDCRTARKCMLVPYKPKGETGGCCPGQTPHHLIEVHCFTPSGERAEGGRLRGFARYDDEQAPCVCCDESSRYHGDHGSMHAIQGMVERSCMADDGPRSQMGGNDGAWNYGSARDGALTAHKSTFADSNCRDGCLAAQLDAYHSQVGVKNDSTPLRADRSPLTDEQKEFGEAEAFG
jgi:hypothetical protein